MRVRHTSAASAFCLAWVLAVGLLKRTGRRDEKIGQDIEFEEGKEFKLTAVEVAYQPKSVTRGRYEATVKAAKEDEG